MRAPDFIEPIVGWRLWHVVETEAGLRLRSPLYRTLWVPRQEVVADCRRGAESQLLSYWPGKSRHAPPHARCRCGIYGSQTAAQAAAYLTGFFKQRADVLHRVIGLVSLWGTLVECESGWRASHACPAAVYVPAPRRRRLTFLTGLPQPSIAPEEVALALADYRVPVAVVDCATISDLAERLEMVASSTR